MLWVDSFFFAWASIFFNFILKFKKFFQKILHKKINLTFFGHRSLEYSAFLLVDRLIAWLSDRNDPWLIDWLIDWISNRTSAPYDNFQEIFFTSSHTFFFWPNLDLDRAGFSRQEHGFFSADFVSIFIPFSLAHQVPIMESTRWEARCVDCNSSCLPRSPWHRGSRISLLGVPWSSARSLWCNSALLHYVSWVASSVSRWTWRPPPPRSSAPQTGSCRLRVRNLFDRRAWNTRKKSQLRVNSFRRQLTAPREPRSRRTTILLRATHPLACNVKRKILIIVTTDYRAFHTHYKHIIHNMAWSLAYTHTHTRGGLHRRKQSRCCYWENVIVPCRLVSGV